MGKRGQTRMPMSVHVAKDLIACNLPDIFAKWIMALGCKSLCWGRLVPGFPTYDVSHAGPCGEVLEPSLDAERLQSVSCLPRRLAPVIVERLTDEESIASEEALLADAISSIEGVAFSMERMLSRSQSHASQKHRGVGFGTVRALNKKTALSAVLLREHLRDTKRLRSTVLASSELVFQELLREFCHQRLAEPGDTTIKKFGYLS